MNRKWLIIILLIAVFGLGGYFIKVFPDPYHEEDGVNFFTWVWREFAELAHGEQG